MKWMMVCLSGIVFGSLSVPLSAQSASWSSGAKEVAKQSTSTGAESQDEKVALILKDPRPNSVGESELHFELKDSTTKKNLADADLKIDHEVKIHFLAYDPSLNDFIHVHPVASGDIWKTKIEFARTGSYFVWAQGLLNDGTEFTAGTRLNITAGEAPEDTVNLVETLKGEDRGSIVSMTAVGGAKVAAGQATVFKLQFQRTDKKPVVIKPYLGAFAHIVVTPQDGSDLLHVHPSSDAKRPSEGTAHVTFPKAGMYRIWIQFYDHNVLKTVPLAVKIETAESASAPAKPDAAGKHKH